MDQAVTDRILGFWLSVEYLQPSPAPDASPKAQCWNAERDDQYPWQDRAKQAQLPDTERYTWRFIAYAGLLDMSATVRQLRALLGVCEDPNKEFRAGKPSAVLAIPVDRAGLAAGDVSVGSLAWAIGRIEEAKGRCPSFEGFQEFEARLRQRAREFLLGRAALSPVYAKQLEADPAEVSLNPLEHEDILGLLDLTFAECGWTPPRIEMPARVKAVRVSRKREELEADDAVILNSFVADDIDRVRRAVRAGDYGVGLERYLFGTEEPSQDLVHDLGAAYSQLWPERFPAGRWASKHPLVFAQQLAVNAVFGRLGAQPGIFSINGPPGTGKTTLLRDVVAGLVVERARRLSELARPADAFGSRHEIAGQEYGYFDPASDLSGYGVVVASANNGAVENVTKELPALEAVDADLDEQPDYFAAVAETVLSEGEKRAVGTCWGLMGAVLGSRGNRSKFIERFWFVGAPENPRADAPISLRTALVQARDTALNWDDARARFIALLAQVEAETKRVQDQARVVWNSEVLAGQLSRLRAEADDRAARLSRLEAAEASSLETAASAAREQQDCDVRLRAVRGYQVAHARLHELSIASPPASREAVKEDLDDVQRHLDQARRDFDVTKAAVEGMVPPSWVSRLLRRASLATWKAERAWLQGELTRNRDRLTEIENRAAALGKALRRTDEWVAAIRDAEAALAAATESCREAGVPCDTDVATLDRAALAARDAARAGDAAAAKTRIERETAERELGATTRKLEKSERDLSALRADLTARGLSREQARAWFLWSAADATRQLAAPWYSGTLHDLRCRLFLAALDLHKTFAVHAGGKLGANLRAFAGLMSGSIRPSQLADGGRALWETFFLVVPVVSTTFASFGRLFSGLGRESLGWLLVDEAGQAAPQDAISAIWRARRTVVVGDPLQLEPVRTLPPEAVHALRVHAGVEVPWDPAVTSTQGLADRANPLGTRIAPDGPAVSNGNDAEDEGAARGIWVGSPLRVHRRCLNPMFTIANRIAYNDLMVYGTVPSKAEAGKVWLGESCWIDMSADGADGHWIPAQGRAAAALVRRVVQAEGGLRQVDGTANVYLITPFRVVQDNARPLLAASYGRSEVKRICGTVHTFQGKEADVVVLLLGGDPAKPGAISGFAAAKPNLLNVALTRARRRIYVVGSRTDWMRARYFGDLAAALPVASLETVLDQGVGQGRSAQCRF